MLLSQTGWTALGFALDWIRPRRQMNSTSFFQAHSDEGRYEQHLERYYDEVIKQLGQPEKLLIFGPGEAKLQLKARLATSKSLPGHTVDIETADKLTDPQIIAKVKEHYGIGLSNA